MTNWADVEFSKLAKYRRDHDLLSLAADFLSLCDFLVSLICGQLAVLACMSHFPAEAPAANIGTFVPEIVLGSLVFALALRDPLMSKRPSACSLSSLALSSGCRFVSAYMSVMAAIIMTQGWKILDQPWPFIWFGAVASAIVLTRLAFCAYVAGLKKSGALRESVVIVGTTELGERVATRIASETDIVGFYQTPPNQADPLRQDEMACLQKLGAGRQVDSVVVAIEGDRVRDISPLVERLKILPIQVAICAETQTPAAASQDVRLLGGIPMEVVLYRPLTRHDFLVKMIFDKTVASLMLLLLLPLMIVVALSIFLTSRGPVLFRQRRQGWCGTHFTMLKFRTMHDTMKTTGKFRQTSRHDTRCTAVGKFLRRTSLDELPQLWNVICGDMSLVGPRPHAEMLDEADCAARRVITEYAQRHRVKPGMTGWAQIHGARGATEDVEQLRKRISYDLYYIQHWSLWIDIEILLRTPLCMMGRNVF